jgi:hypothetical protein
LPAFFNNTKSTSSLLYSQFLIKGINTENISIKKENFKKKRQHKEETIESDKKIGLTKINTSSRSSFKK